MPVSRAAPAALLLFALAAGCAQSDDDPAPTSDAPTTSPYAPVIDVPPIVAPTAPMTFRNSIVTPALGVAADLYEPSMEVSDTGTIYVAGHVIGAATTGTPAWYSNDDGATWTQLPFIASVSSPLPTGGQLPPGDEGFIVAGDDGQAWMSDIYAAGYTITGWCDDGRTQCYDNRYGYDRTATVANEHCGNTAAPDSLNDRPWIAYGNHMLLLVNNPGGGPMQIGSMPAPPATPVGLFDPVTGPQWNLCATEGGGIPGVPAARKDGFFAVPQTTGGSNDQTMLQVVVGNIANIFDVRVTAPFEFTSSGPGTSNGGRTAFDGRGNLFVGIRNNTQEDSGAFRVAVSRDDGLSWVNVTFATEMPLESLYLDSNLLGDGVLVTWSQASTTAGRADWYVGHLFVGDNNEPVLRNVSLAVDDGPRYSAHVMGASVGPDGRAYFVNFDEAPAAQDYALSTPISVWIQESGPTLPVTLG